MAVTNARVSICEYCNTVFTSKITSALLHCPEPGVLVDDSLYNVCDVSFSVACNLFA